MNVRTIATLLMLTAISLAGCDCDDDDSPPSMTSNNATNNATNNVEGNNDNNDDPMDAGMDVGDDSGPDADDAASLPDVPTGGDFMEAKQTPIDGVYRDLDLTYPVHVTRDEYGIPHIMAESVEDAIYVQGYVHALDRFAQMELIRAQVNGTIARVAGAVDGGTVEDDMRTRVIALRFTAQKILDQMDPEDLDYRVLQAYTDGVNAYISRFKAGEEGIPTAAGVLVSPATLQDWTILDSLALVRFQQYSLSFDSPRELRKTRSRAAAMENFPADATDPAIAKRSAILMDMDRFAPADPTYIVPEFTGVQGKPELPGGGEVESRPWRAPKREVLDNAIGLFDSLQQNRIGWLTTDGRGLSNSWAITGELSATGNPVLANDPHLSMDSPALFHEIHLVVEPRTEDDGPAFNVFGSIFPGLPGVLIGHNESVAWALTTASYDYSDAYVEELVWTEGEEWPQVRRNGELVDVEVREEVIEVGGFGSITDTITVELAWIPGHGPLVPTIEDGEVTYPREDEGISWAWTGYSVSHEIRAIMGFITSASMADVRVALDDWVIGTQNMLFADVNGEVFQTGHSYIPTRPPEAMDWDPVDNPGGNAPWWTLRGTGEHDWDGRLADDMVPQVTNPEEGWVVTANNDQAGVTDDNNPLNDYAYVGYDWAIGFRAGRITRRLDNQVGEFEEGHKFTLEEVGDIQYDIYSNVGARLTPYMLETLARALEEYDAADTHADVAPIVASHPDGRARVEMIQQMLQGWDFEAEDGMWGEPTQDQIASSRATSFFNVWATLMLTRAFGDEVAAAPGLEGGSTRFIKTALHLLDSGDQAATWDAELGDSILWDDMQTQDVTETHHAIALATFFEAFPKMAELFGSEMPEDWLWGKVHTRTFDSIIPSIGGGQSVFTLPQEDEWANGFPRGGDTANVNRCDGGLSDFRYSCGGGAIMHYVIELDPDGVRSFNTVPGGEVWDPASPHFRDLLDLWLDHERHENYIRPAQVGGHVEDHAVFVP